MYPQLAISEHLLDLHDAEGDGEQDTEDRRRELIMFSEELEEPIMLKRSPAGDV